MIEPVIQRYTGDADAVIAHVGEIGKPQPARRMPLPEDDVLLGAVLETKRGDTQDLKFARPVRMRGGVQFETWKARIALD